MSETTRSTWWTPVDLTPVRLREPLPGLAHQRDRFGEDHPDRVAHLIGLLVGGAGQVEPADRRHGHAYREVDRLVGERHPLSLLGLLHELGHGPLQLLGVAAAEHIEGELAHAASI